MIPINKTKETCTPTSSNCVKWPAVELEGIDICRDASVTEVILALSEKLKNIIDTLNIDTYELKCLENAKCGPQEFSDLVQLIINKLCELSSNNGVDIGSLVLEIDNECFRNWNDNHTDVTISNYAKIIAEKICEIYTELENVKLRLDNAEETILEHTSSITNLQETKQDKLDLRDCDGSSIPSSDISLVLQTVLDFVCIGNKFIIKNNDPEEIYNSACDEESLSDSTVSLTDNTTITDNIKSLWSLVCDTRKAVKQIQETLNVPVVNFAAFITCGGKIWYKGSCTYKGTISNAVINFHDNTGDYSGVEVELTQNPILLDGSYELPSGKDKIEGNGTVNYDSEAGAGTQAFVFYIKSAISDFEHIGKKITFKKNISFKKIILTRDGEPIKQFAADLTGNIVYEDNTLTYVPGQSYSFALFVEDEDTSCASFTYIAPWPETVKPDIEWNGEVDDEDKININTVLPEEYDDWVAKFE